MAERKRCSCGRVMSKSATRCTKCYKEHMDQVYAAASRIVETGKCPDCGAPLRRNLALCGWWQCSQFGAEGFRADSSKPQCDYQTFTKE